MLRARIPGMLDGDRIMEGRTPAEATAMRLSRTQQCARLVQGRRSRVCDKTLYGWGVNLHHVHELDRRRPSELACLHVDSEGGDSATRRRVLSSSIMVLSSRSAVSFIQYSLRWGLACSPTMRADARAEVARSKPSRSTCALMTLSRDASHYTCSMLTSRSASCPSHALRPT